MSALISGSDSPKKTPENDVRQREGGAGLNDASNMKQGPPISCCVSVLFSTA